jgi:peptidoglycan/LPS O-acetylase OafA/YrhL
VPEVDALRGMAMTLVILIHCKLAPFGWMGVWLFYVVSGFSVTTSLFGGRQRPSSIGAAVRGFYARRARRIWPLYFAFVGINIVVLLAVGWIEPLQEIPWLLSFTYNLKMIFTVYTPQTEWGAFGHLWTLSVEQQFYLVFPLLLLVRGRAARGFVLLGVIALAPLIRAAFGHWVTSLGWDAERAAFAVYAFAPAHFDAFAIGTLIALFRAEITADRRIAYAAMALAALITLVYGGVYATIGVIQAGHLSLEAMRNIFSGILYGQGREIFGYWVPVSIGAAALTGILCGQPHCLRICRVPSLQAIGRISYGGYIFHIPVLMMLGVLVPVYAVPAASLRGIVEHIGLFACAYPITIGIAWLSFTFFERPISRLVFWR